MAIPASTDTLAASAIAGSLAALAVTTAVVPITIRLARRTGIIDEPGARSSHTVATPRLGGIGVAVGALVGLVVATLLGPATLRVAGDGDVRFGVGLGVTALLFGLIGLADDLLRGIPVSARLGAQIVVGGVASFVWVAGLDRQESPSNSWVAVAPAAAVGAIWLIGYVNAFNFMDGIDGISGFVAVVVGFDLVAVGLLDDRSPLVVAGAVLVGAAVGFLVFNLRPASVFLGDGGSYFLGAWIAMTIAFGVVTDTPPEALVAVTVPYLADTATTLVRRVIGGADWRASHHEHAYQQLIEQGRSHREVALTVAGVSGLCAAFGLVSLSEGPLTRIAAAIAIVAVSGAYVLSPRINRRRASSPGEADSAAATH